MHGTLAEEVGLAFRPTFARDRQFWWAIAVAPVALVLMDWLLPAWREGIQTSTPRVLAMVSMVSMVLFQPLVEEVFFRGVIQGQLERVRWAQRRFAGLSAANYLTTLLFSLAHLVHHPPVMAAAVVVPSLIFGHFRDRHRQVYPAFLLHAFYNACYLLT